MNLTGYEDMAFDVTVSDKLLAKAYELIWNLRMYASENSPLQSCRLEINLKITGVQLRALISYLRIKGTPQFPHGVPIASGSTGYWLASDRASLASTVAHMRERGLKDLAVAYALEKIYPPPEQESLEL